MSQTTKDPGISAELLEEYLKEERPLLIFDLRQKKEFVKSHIKGSVHAVCDTRAKETIMPKIPKNVKIVLISEPEEFAKDTAKMMGSFGLDASYLIGGFSSWKGPIGKGETGHLISPEKLYEKLDKNNVFLLDVREKEEFSDYKISGSVNIPLKNLFDKKTMTQIPKGKQVVTVCPHGNRAMVASFALQRAGLESYTLEGGLAGWNQVLSQIVVEAAPARISQVHKVGKGCLSYVIDSHREAIVIDPLFPAAKYTEIAQKHGFKITKVLDTHQHADHVSAARELAKETGAELVLSKYENYDHDARFVGDGDKIKFGKSLLRVIHTPGHTLGSLSFVVDEKFVFTGDILFVESIGRPDLRDKAEEFTKVLYKTLHEKLLTLPRNIQVFPAHHGEKVIPKDGAFYTTIKDAQKLPLLDLPENDFVKKVVSMTLPRPMNYQKIIQINKGEVELDHKNIPDLEIGPNRCAVNAR